MLLICFLYLSYVVAENTENQNIWVILVAGSNGWVNYRHQADVAHAYFLLRTRGIPKERIITFSYDDIAFNKQNPYEGKLYNDYNHKDYYEGLIIDYKGVDVSSAMFGRVITGDPTLKAQGKKVLDSGGEDNVFIYFTGHADPMKLLFPKDYLSATQLKVTITVMHFKKMYKNLLIYVDACFSGSMFESLLPNNINAYATTAAMATESSRGAFCNDPFMSVCLADEYSYNWMTDSETHDPTQETLRQQFINVQTMTKYSHPQEYGDSTVSKLSVSGFQGSKKTNVNFTMHTVTKDHIPSHQAHIHSLMRAVMLAESTDAKSLAKRRLMRAILLEELVEETMNIVVDTINSSKPSRISIDTTAADDKEACYITSSDTFTMRCFSTQRVPEVTQQLQKLMNLCQTGVPAMEIINVIQNVCL